jgi:hypothetical protein
MLKIRLSDEETKLLKIIFGTLQKIDDKLMIKATPNEVSSQCLVLKDSLYSENSIAKCSVSACRYD